MSAKIPSFKNEAELKKALDKAKDPSGTFLGQPTEEGIVKVGSKGDEKVKLVNDAIEKFENSLEGKPEVKSKVYFVP